MRRGQTDGYPAFPEIKEQLGYNPARFLVPTDNEMDELSWTARATVFIRGMEDVETVRAWITVEVALEQDANGGPRKQVIKWLNHRQAAIEGTSLPAEQNEDHESARDETTSTADTSVQPTPAEAEVSTTTALAADGGETPDETPLCPDCHGECSREEIAGKTGYWCPSCQEFQKPAPEGRA